MDPMMPDDAKVPEPGDTLTAYVVSELVGLESLLEELAWAVEGGRLSEARALVRRFERALEQHVRIEEDLLLPVFIARTGVDGPAASLCAEHREAARGAGLMRDGLAAGDVTVFGEGLRFVREIMPGHHSKEHILYPAVDMLLSAPEKARLMRRLRSQS
jgi:hemerythrin HHE cation binding domain-containing protein